MRRDPLPSMLEAMRFLKNQWPEAVLAAVFLGICFSLVFTRALSPLLLTDDASQYSALAFSIINKGVYALDGITPFFEREPGYSFFLGGLYLMFGTESLIPVFLTQAFIHLFAALLLCIVIERRFGRQIGLIAFGLLTLSPPVFHAVFSVTRESLALSLAMLLSAMLLRLYEERRMYQAVLSGALLGLLFLTYAVFLLFPFFLITLLFLWKVRPALIIVSVATCIAVMLPWAVRNYRHTGMLCMTGCYRSAIQWHVRGVQSQTVTGLEPMRCLIAEYITRDYDGRSPDCHFNSVFHRKWPDGFSGVPEDAAIGIEGRKNILAHLPNYLWFSVFEVVELHLPYVNGWGTVYNVLAILWSAIIYLGCLLAIPLWRRKEHLLFAAFALYVTGLFALTDALPRYLVPVLFAYAAWAAIGYDRLLKRIWQK